MDVGLFAGGDGNSSRILQGQINQLVPLAVGGYQSPGGGSIGEMKSNRAGGFQALDTAGAIKKPGDGGGLEVKLRAGHYDISRGGHFFADNSANTGSADLQIAGSVYYPITGLDAGQQQGNRKQQQDLGLNRQVISSHGYLSIAQGY